MDGTHCANQLGQFNFTLGRRAEAGANRQNLAQRIDDRRKAVTQDQRPPGEDIVDVFVAVDVEDM